MPDTPPRPYDSDPWYEARKELDAAGRNKDKRDSRPARGPWPAPRFEDAIPEHLMARTRDMKEALNTLWEQGSDNPMLLMRAAVTIRLIRSLYGEFLLGELRLDPRWESWLAAWDAGEARSIPLEEPPA